MEFEYLVKKQFASNDTVYNVGDIVEMKAEYASDFIAKGNLELHKEEKVVDLKVDTKSLTDAIASGFAQFAPKLTKVEEKMNYGEYLQAIAKGDVETKNINITTDGQGAYATTEFIDPMVDTDLIRESGVARALNLVTLNGTNNVYKFNVVSSLGNAPAITAEGSTINASQPTVTQFAINLVKATYRFDATEEALEDTGALVSEINSAVPEEFSKFIEDGVLNGNTAFTGIIGDTNTVTVAKESGQTDDTIVAENIDKMFVSSKNPSRSVWIMSRSAYGAVQGLEDSAGNRIFVGPTGLAASPFGTLKGLPIMISDYSAALGTVGDILLCNLGKYKMAAKGRLKLTSSSHVKFLTDETVFKFIFRLGGLPASILLTATDSTEVSDFVELAGRGSA